MPDRTLTVADDEDAGSRSWPSDRQIDVLGIALAIAPWAVPGESAIVHALAVGGCVLWWMSFRWRLSSFEIPMAIIPLSINLRLLLYVLG